MFCLNPTKIVNQSRFITRSSRFPLALYVACGKCANCQKKRWLEWYYRAYKHFENCVNHNGYVLFDCLTYRPADLPHLTDFEGFEDLPSRLDFPSFSRQDLRLFFVRLRKLLSMRGIGKDAFTYFVSSEYGTRPRDGKTQRPHYHVLFFVTAPIDSLEFSRLVARAWSYGRTDGVPYKSNQYVLSNTFRSMAVGGRKVSQYVTKYVQKSSEFQKEIEKRISRVLFYRYGLAKLDSVGAVEYAKKLRRIVAQFHLQSQGFGLSALDGVDLDSLIEDGFFRMPSDDAKRVLRVPICSYYLRKLFYDKVTLDDGYVCWSLNSDGVKYMAQRQKNLQRYMADNYSASLFGLGIDNIDSEKLADYVLNYRGRLPGLGVFYRQLGDVLEDVQLYNYSSIADKNHFNLRFLTSSYCGYKDNYIDAVVAPIRVADVLESGVYNDSCRSDFMSFDTVLSKIDDYNRRYSDEIQERFDNTQRRVQIYKALF